jgi:hypothetical protein
METKDPGAVGRRLLLAFRSGYPHLTMRIVWDPLKKRAWSATVRRRESDRIVAEGVRHDRIKAIEAALEAIPEAHRRAPRGTPTAPRSDPPNAGSAVARPLL